MIYDRYYLLNYVKSWLVLLNCNVEWKKDVGVNVSGDCCLK